MRFLVLLIVVSSGVALAGNLPAGAGCSNPNQCVSKICSQKRCAPSGDHPGPVGAVCTTNGHCKSKNCANRTCAPPKAEKARSTSSGGGSRALAADDDEEEEEAKKPPEPEPLPEPTPCSEDLLATVYKKDPTSRASQFHARDNCKYYSPEIIERAKKLFLDGFGYNFAITLRTVKEATPEQIACAQKEYDKKRYGNFEVPNLCRQSSAVMACADDLSPSVFKDKDDAKDECKKRSPEVIAEAKKMYLEKYGDSFRNIADVLEKATPEQAECARRDYEFRTEGRTKFMGFSLSGVCERDAAVIACYFDLFDTVMKDQRYDYRARDSAEAICRRTDDKDVESLALARQMRKAGYTVEFARLVNDMKSMSGEQRACVKKLNLVGKVPENEKDTFRLPKACKK